MKMSKIYNPFLDEEVDVKAVSKPIAVAVLTLTVEFGTKSELAVNKDFIAALQPVVKFLEESAHKSKILVQEKPSDSVRKAAAKKMTDEHLASKAVKNTEL